MKIMTNDLLDIISKSTINNKGSLWLENIEYNEEEFGFNDTISGIKTTSKKSLVLAAGPRSKIIFGENFEEIRKNQNEMTIVACDGALSMLSKKKCIPDYVVSVDGDPIIANFYKNSKDILNDLTVILATSVHPSVVEHCLDAGAKIKWVQSFFNNDSHKAYFRKGIPSIKMGGNVGTASYLLTSLVLKGNPIGLLGIEFAWSDETPYQDTHYYNELMETLEQKSDKVKDYFVHIKNDLDGKIYMADPVYYAYYLMFKEIWEDELPLIIKQNTYNLTLGGILSLEGLQYKNIKKFLSE